MDSGSYAKRYYNTAKRFAPSRSGQELVRIKRDSAAAKSSLGLSLKLNLIFVGLKQWVEDDAAQAKVLGTARRALEEEALQTQKAQRARVLHSRAWEAAEQVFGGMGPETFVGWAVYKHLRGEFYNFINEELSKAADAEVSEEDLQKLPKFPYVLRE